MLTFILLFTLLKDPLLRVTPVQGFNPVKIYSVRYPEKSDIEWELVAVEDGFVARRYTVTVEGLEGDRVISLEWNLTPGPYVIASCVYPRKSCTVQNIEVR